MPRTTKEPKETKKSATKKPAKAKAPAKTAASKKPASKKTPAAKKPAKHSASKPHKAAAKPHAKAPVKKGKPAKAVKKVALPTDKFSETEKEELLGLMERVVSIRKNSQGGARSLARIDLILNPHNQKYRTVEQKFVAAVQTGLSSDLDHKNTHFYMAQGARLPDEQGIYEVLVGIGQGSVDFTQAKQKIQDILK